MNNFAITKQLIKKGSQFSPVFGDRLASHLPMALLALSNMGASEKQLNDFYEFYTGKLEKFDENLTSTKITNIKDFLGDSSKLQDYIYFFNEEMKKLGCKKLLNKYLDILSPGLAASAFHAIIRLAYGIEAKIDSEIVVSLAYLASDFTEFKLNEKSLNISFLDLLKKVNKVSVNYQFPKGIIVDKMNAIAKELINMKQSIHVNNVTLQEISDVCVNLYLNHPNFTILHTITACHAIRLLLPYINDKQKLTKHATEGVVLALLSTGIGFNFEKKRNEDDYIDIQELKLNACKSLDEHVIKLVYSCIKEYEFSNKIEYLKVAKVKLSNN